MQKSCHPVWRGRKVAQYYHQSLMEDTRVITRIRMHSVIIAGGVPHDLLFIAGDEWINWWGFFELKIEELTMPINTIC